MNTPSDTHSAAIERLRVETLGNPGSPPKKPRKLSLSAIHVEPSVFQVRKEGLNDDRVLEIAGGLSGTSLDDPIHVWWSGLRWIVVEGHHRHAAYLLKQERGDAAVQVPVSAHSEKSLEEVMGLAGRLNDREKVKISGSEKMNSAWRMVCAGEGSIRQQSVYSGVAKSTISNMRNVKAALLSGRRPIAQLINAGWKQSREWAHGKTHRDHSPEALEMMAQDMAKELKKLKTTSAVKSPHVFARAIEIISPVLPRRLVESDPFWDALHTTGRMLLDEIDAEEAEGNGNEGDAHVEF